LQLGFLLVLISTAAAIWAYPHVPAQVPAHFDIGGHADGYVPKLVGVSLWPVSLFVLCLLMPILPAISPKGFRFDESADVLNLVLIGVIVLEFAVGMFVIWASIFMATPPVGFMNLMVGALFVLIGNYLGKVRKNFFLGVRTPWTLASDEVWLRTHRLASWLFVLGGFIIAALSFVKADMTTPNTIVISILVIVPVVYSFVIYKRIEGFTVRGSDGA
jgi:uncharacterized membrane protein